MASLVLILVYVILPVFWVWGALIKAAKQCEHDGRRFLRSVWVKPAKSRVSSPLPPAIIDRILESYLDANAGDEQTVFALLKVSHDIHNATRHALRKRADERHDLAMHIVTNALQDVVTGFVNAKVYNHFQLALLRWWPLRRGAEIAIDIDAASGAPYSVLYEPRLWTIYEMAKLDYLYIFLQRKAIPFAVHRAFVRRGVLRAYDNEVAKQLWRDTPEELFFNKSGAAYIMHTCMLFMSCARLGDRIVVRGGPDAPPTLQQGESGSSPPVLRVRCAASAWVFSQAAHLAAEQLHPCPVQAR